MADLKISALTSATTPLVGTEQVPLVQSGTTKKTTTTDLLSVGNGTTTFGPVLNGAGSGANAGIYYLLQNGGTTTIGMGNKSSLLGGAYSAIPIFYFNGQADFYDNATLRGRWDSSGNLAVANGNVVISTSGKGIDFSATSGTGTSELLADYEEGTWTATLSGSTTNPLTPQTTTGTYVKVGRSVTVQAYFNNADTTGGLGDLSITGLPYTVGTVRGAAVIGMSGFGTAPAFGAAIGTIVYVANMVNTTAISINAGPSKFLYLLSTYQV